MAGNLALARDCFRQAVEFDASLGRAHFNLGNVLLDLDDASGALEAFLRAIDCKPDSATAHFNAGNACLRLGHLVEAIDLYRKALTLKADFVDALVAKGVALLDLGRAEESISAFRAALAITPNYAEVYFNLSGALLAQGDTEGAIGALRQAISLKPNYFDACLRLGSTLGGIKRFEESKDALSSALAIRADDIDALTVLANVHAETGDKNAAVECYRRMLEKAPDNAELQSDVGVALTKLGRPEDSLPVFRRALELSPDIAVIHSNLGVALKKLGRYKEAVASYRRALALKPDFPEALNNMGTVLHKLGQVAEAEKSYRSALALQPTNSDIHNNIGTLCQNLGHLTEAASSYRRSLECDPSYIDAYSNLGSVLAELGQLEQATECYKKALELDPQYAIAHSNLLFTNNYMSEHSSSPLLVEARQFGEMVAAQAKPFTSWKCPPEINRKLRVGIVSADFRQHPVGYFAENVLRAVAKHAASRVSLIALSNHPQYDEFTKRIKSACAAWHDVYGMSDQQLANLIHDEAIDILIDLSGHTAENRLPAFAWKAAPVQVTWLGYFATTGVSEIDYLIADPWTLPPEEEQFFTERIWRLPETRLCFTPPKVDLPVSGLPALTSGQITFGCFNNLTKVTDMVVAVWSTILKTVPKSRLFMKARALQETTVQEELISRFSKYGIGRERLILEGYVPRSDYLAAYHRIDIGLDPFPYPGGTTTAEALWMGVPVLTLAGERFLARQGVGLLMNAGLPDWVATDQEDYVSRAVANASNLEHLASLRAGLRQQVLASPIFDATRFARHFEAALRGMWEKWCHDQDPLPSKQTSSLPAAE